MRKILITSESSDATDKLLDAVSKGSGDSFVLRNHGMKAMLPREFPDKAFSPEYVLKDISYVFELAAQSGVALPSAAAARRYYEVATTTDLSGRYFPGVIELVERGVMAGDKGEAE